MIAMSVLGQSSISYSSQWSINLSVGRQLEILLSTEFSL